MKTHSPRKSNEIRIKNIPDIPSEIFDAAKRGKLVLFIGAGVSRIIGCPSWYKLATLYLKDLRKKKSISFHEYKHLESLDARKLLSICMKIYEEGKNIVPADLNSFLKGKDKLIEEYRIYEHLYNFNVIYVTTNYDDYLAKEARKTHLEPPKLIANSISEDVIRKEKQNIFSSKKEMLTVNLDKGNVLYLHGRIQNQDRIMTIVDYMSHYEKGSEPSVLLEEIFVNHTVLFIGYGLEEYEILEFMISKSHIVEKELKHFMLYPIFQEEFDILRRLEKYYLSFGVKLIPYPIDNDGYEHLSKVIENWSKQIGPVSQPKEFLEKIRLIDEVLE
jgi:hypothetical protein